MAEKPPEDSPNLVSESISMKSKIPDGRQKSNKQPGFLRGAGVAVAAIVAMLLLLTVTAWAGWSANGYARVLRLGNWDDSLQASLTATPTKTPRPVTPEPTQVAVDLMIVAPGPTAATALPTATPKPVTTPEPMLTRLAEVAKQYGIDPSRRFVVVDAATQQMIVWEPGRPPKEIPVSTGDESRGYRTRAWYGLVGKYVGTFQAHGVYADEGWYLFEDAGSILIHSAPYKLVNGVKVYEDMEALGSYPASRGCIRLRPEDARWFTEWGPKGVPLVILPRNAG
jgi:lipoprotein-anchoring transpeptidase ErfK/SrfK